MVAATVRGQTGGTKEKHALRRPGRRFRRDAEAPDRPRAGRLQQDELLHRQGSAARHHLLRFKLFENERNKKYRTGKLKIHVVFRPVVRGDLAAALLDGRGGVAAANLTVTPERLERVDFSNPTARNVSEIVVGAVLRGDRRRRRPFRQGGLRPEGVDLR